jgi:hypothetical protein
MAIPAETKNGFYLGVGLVVAFIAVGLAMGLFRGVVSKVK